jgi:hypothetical protein
MAQPYMAVGQVALLARLTMVMWVVVVLAQMPMDKTLQLVFRLVRVVLVFKTTLMATTIIGLAAVVARLIKPALVAMVVLVAVAVAPVAVALALLEALAVVLH